MKLTWKDALNYQRNLLDRLIFSKKKQETVQGPAYVGFYARICAVMIDLLLLIVLLMPLQPFLNSPPSPQMLELLGARQQGMITDQELTAGWLNYFLYGGGLQQFIYSLLLQYMILGVITLLCWYQWSATPGKLLLRMKIVDAITGEKPSFLQMIVRYLGYFPSGLIAGFGFWWIYLNRKRQGWHDKMADTVVIYAKKTA